MNVVVVIGAGSIGQAIARRVGAGMDGGVTASYRFGDLAPK
jgi:predicted dinucleotide-binding enzyme